MKCRIVKLLMVCLFVAACSGDSHDDTGAVVYSASGSCASGADVTYAQGNSTEQVTAHYPWSISFAGRTSEFVYVSAQNNCGSGSVSVQITFRGNLVDSATSSGAYVIATASGTL